MNYKIITGIFLTVLLSSCCWFVRYDCAENNTGPFSIAIEMNNTDSIHDSNNLLEVTVKSTSFLSTFEEEAYDNINFSVQATWFDGNFSSNANHQVNALNSNIGNLTLAEYSSYNGTLPSDDIRFDLEFTVPGYYLIQFRGGANRMDNVKRNRKSHCGSCGAYTYTDFAFENANTNNQFFDLYNLSTPYDEDLTYILAQGGYFIKVE